MDIRELGGLLGGALGRSAGGGMEWSVFGGKILGRTLRLAGLSHLYSPLSPLHYIRNQTTLGPFGIRYDAGQLRVLRQGPHDGAITKWPVGVSELAGATQCLSLSTTPHSMAVGPRI